MCLSLAPRPAGGEESVSFYICHHSGPLEVLNVVACIVQWQNRFLDCLLFLEICLRACVCVPAGSDCDVGGWLVVPDHHF